MERILIHVWRILLFVKVSSTKKERKKKWSKGPGLVKNQRAVSNTSASVTTHIRKIREDYFIAQIQVNLTSILSSNKIFDIQSPTTPILLIIKNTINWNHF